MLIADFLFFSMQGYGWIAGTKYKRAQLYWRTYSQCAVWILPRSGNRTVWSSDSCSHKQQLTMADWKLRLCACNESDKMSRSDGRPPLEAESWQETTGVFVSLKHLKAYTSIKSRTNKTKQKSTHNQSISKLEASDGWISILAQQFQNKSQNNRGEY